MKFFEFIYFIEIIIIIIIIFKFIIKTNNFAIILLNLNNKLQDRYLSHIKHFQILFINILFIIKWCIII